MRPTIAHRNKSHTVQCMYTDVAGTFKERGESKTTTFAAKIEGSNRQ